MKKIWITAFAMFALFGAVFAFGGLLRNNEMPEEVKDTYLTAIQEENYEVMYELREEYGMMNKNRIRYEKFEQIKEMKGERINEPGMRLEKSIEQKLETYRQRNEFRNINKEEFRFKECPEDCIRCIEKS